MSDELKELEDRFNARLDNLKTEMKGSLRAVHNRVDDVYKAIGAVPGQGCAYSARSPAPGADEERPGVALKAMA